MQHLSIEHNILKDMFNAEQEMSADSNRHFDNCSGVLKMTYCSFAINRDLDSRERYQSHTVLLTMDW